MSQGILKGKMRLWLQSQLSAQKVVQSWVARIVNIDTFRASTFGQTDLALS